MVLSAHNSVIDYKGLIDEFNVPIDLEETGFYVIEKVGNKLITRYSFFRSSEFNMLMFRNKDPLKKFVLTHPILTLDVKACKLRDCKLISNFN